jgi:hypothetical protein
MFLYRFSLATSGKEPFPGYALGFLGRGVGLGIETNGKSAHPLSRYMLRACTIRGLGLGIFLVYEFANSLYFLLYLR